MKLLTVTSLSALLFVTAGQALAFHDGGVASCDGCHTMHNSSGGQPMATGKAAGSGNRYLLRGSDPSSTCLLCHASSVPGDSYRVVTSPPPGPGNPPVQLSPGGDFAYLQKNYSWVNSVTGQTTASSGDSHGHNIVAADFLFFPDGRYSVAPGGSYPSSNLSCTSCHDPHGKYRLLDNVGTISTSGKPTIASGSYGNLPTATTAVGAYRLLGGVGYLPASMSTTPAAAFVNNPPIAVSPPLYNRSESTNDVRVAYGNNISEWCANCHGSYQHTLTGTSKVAAHPSGASAKLLAVADEYNAYLKSYLYTGTIGTAYTSLVPFEEGSSDLTALTADTGATTGATTGDNVTCLTCHRAHASAWDSATRWNMAPGAYLTVAGSWPGTNAPNVDGMKGENATGKTVQEYQQSMYDRNASAYALNQGSLCNKCHWNDSHQVQPP